MLELILQRLSDNFSSQHLQSQQLFSNRLGLLRRALYSCSQTSVQRVPDAHCRLLLSFVTATFESLYGPSSTASNEVVSIKIIAMLAFIFL